MVMFFVVASVVCLIGESQSRVNLVAVVVLSVYRCRTTQIFSSHRDQRPLAVRPPEATESRLCSGVFLRAYGTDILYTHTHISGQDTLA